MQKTETLASREAQVAALRHIPALALSEDEAANLTQLGSLQQIANSSVHDITSNTIIGMRRLVSCFDERA